MLKELIEEEQKDKVQIADDQVMAVSSPKQESKLETSDSNSTKSNSSRDEVADNDNERTIQGDYFSV